MTAEAVRLQEPGAVQNAGAKGGAVGRCRFGRESAIRFAWNQAFRLNVPLPHEAPIEISATVSEAVANAFGKKKALPKEGSLVVLRDIAGALERGPGVWRPLLK
jgi:hypothetical protein